jgi:hypothetical protein
VCNGCWAANRSIFIGSRIGVDKFMPSGLVTFYATVGSIASSLLNCGIGKIPALWIEVFAANEVLEWTVTGQVISGLIVFGLLIYGFIKIRKTPSN